MKMKKRSKRLTAWGLAASMCISLFQTSGQPVVSKAADTDTTAALNNPVIDAEKGQVVWDCIYFGNYWQKEYVTQPGNQPEQGEDDVVHIDEDGTKYIVRPDKSCYKYEPVKWRVLSVSEDGTDAFLMADKTLDGKAFHGSYSDTVNWENSDIRAWLNGTFMETAFSEEEQEAIKITEIENLSYSFYYGDTEISSKDGAPTKDRIYLPSLDDMVNTKYGFINNFNATGDVTEHGFSGTEVRMADAVGFANWGEEGYKASSYLLRTLSPFDGYVLRTDGWGEISITKLFGATVNDTWNGIRPVLHLDLTKTELWNYAGKVKQDKTEIAPNAKPDAPTERPTAQPSVTMAPGQSYPKNPVVNEKDLNKNTWDCIWFGNYYNTKVTPSVLASSGEDDTMKTDENGNRYIVRRGQGYFQYEPVKWRVLSINEDGTDAFLMADEVIDLTHYYRDGSVEITWEKSDVRAWLNDSFMKSAFNESEINAIKETTVKTQDNKWSGELGGNDTNDKIYLPSIEEMLEVSYGFSSDEKEENTRKITVTDFAEVGGTPKEPFAGPMVYWLRSQGMKAGYPARVGYWGAGEILTDQGNMPDNAAHNIGVRPVMHVDLTDRSLWTYAGQVTPEGDVVPDVKEPAQPTQKPQQPDTKVKKPGKPVIKKLTNKNGKKVTVTLSKKVSGATGYQVAYAAQPSMKGQKQKTFKGTSVTVNGLKKKKTYYFRVRAYVNKNGKSTYGNWSSKKSVKIKK